MGGVESAFAEALKLLRLTPQSLRYLIRSPIYVSSSARLRDRR
jgi:hypothetical protein